MDKNLFYNIGDKINEFKITGYDFSTGKTQYICECVNCGRISKKSAYYLRPNIVCKCPKCKTLEYLDLIGKRFGCILVVEKYSSDGMPSTHKFKCKCDCGNILILTAQNIRSKRHLCCKACKYKYITENIHSFTKHGMCDTPVYKIWSGINKRCLTKTDKSYKNYGARGIKICYEWSRLNPKGFNNFYTWSIKTGYKYKPDKNGRNIFSIERIDVNGDYCPENCKWILLEEQSKNRTTSIIIEYKGEKKCLAEWCKILNLDTRKVKYRMDKGLTFLETILLKEVKKTTN